MGDYMKLFDNIRNYIGEDEFRIVIYKDSINIINYDNLNEISSNKVIINQVVIEGKNLLLKKILTNELLIKGKIEKIEFNE